MYLIAQLESQQMTSIYMVANYKKLLDAIKMDFPHLKHCCNVKQIQQNVKLTITAS